MSTLKLSRVTLLNKFHKSTRMWKIKENIAYIILIKQLFNRFKPVCQSLQLYLHVIEHYATITIKVHNFQVQRRNEKRYLYLLCFIVHQYYTLQDMLIETLVKVSQTALNKAKKKQQETYFARKKERLKEISELADACVSADKIIDAVRLIIALENVTTEQKVNKIKGLFNRNIEYSTKETLRLVSQHLKEQRREAFDADYFDQLESQYIKMKNITSEIINYISFNEYN